jgi:hypothetical protein
VISAFFSLASHSLRDRVPKGRQAMERKSNEKPPPKSTDLEGWRAAIQEGSLSRFRPEAIAAAFQDLGAQDQAVRRALTKQLSGIIVGMQRRRVDPTRPDNGNDVIFRVQAQIFEALLNPKSADGKALREAFGKIVIYRMKTAFADEQRGWIVPAPKFQRAPKAASNEEDGAAADVADETEEPEEAEALPPTACEDEEAAPGKRAHDPEFMRQVQACDEQIDRDRLVTRVLQTIPTYKKRLAYYLYLHGVPAKSKKESIAKACGVDEKTVRDWIDDIENDLKQNEGVLTLLRTISGARS